MNWWSQLVDRAFEYAKSAKSKNRVSILRALLLLVDSVGRWGGMLAKKGEANAVLSHGLMAEHVIGFKLLADQTPVEDMASVKTALELLSRNADFQAMFFGAGFKDFPHAEFRKLFGIHLESMNGIVKDVVSGDEASLNGHLAAARKNAMDLDQLTVKSLLS